MEDKEHIDDELLGRWLAGDLNDEELKKFKASTSFITYKSIAEMSSNLVVAPYDEEQELKKLHAKKIAKPGKIIQMRRYKWLAAAASIAIIVGVGSLFFFNQNSIGEEISVATLQTEKKTITLPNKSTIDLNIASSITYHTENWEKERKVKLKGEAFFDITKGKPFTVETNSGTIEVLGTTFNIRERNDYIEIVCYSGKVKVTDKNSETIVLSKGNSTRIVSGNLQTDWNPDSSNEPSWISGESTFEDVPLENVVRELENQYGVKIRRSSNFNNRVYSGAFTHDNIEEAARMVFLPMQIEYKIQSDSMIVIK